MVVTRAAVFVGREKRKMPQMGFVSVGGALAAAMSCFYIDRLKETP